jgi:hypothetical protein
LYYIKLKPLFFCLLLVKKDTIFVTPLLVEAPSLRLGSKKPLFHRYKGIKTFEIGKIFDDYIIDITRKMLDERHAVVPLGNESKKKRSTCDGRSSVCVGCVIT